MSSAATTKSSSKMAAAKNATSDSKASSKMHRRSRSGCFTCRLRRKKCEEGKPSCKACKHLGLRCDYKRPMWWGNGEQRRQQKEHIKDIIKRTQLSKKSQQQEQRQHHQQQRAQQHPTRSPPGLTHSLPTSSEYYSESLPQTRAPSVGSPFSTGYDFSQISPDGYFAMPPPPQPMPPHPQYPMFSPYEIDIKTERQMFINDVPTRRDSTISTFSTFQPPPMADGTPAFPADSWVQHEYHESLHESFSEEPVDFNFFQFPHPSMSPNHEAVIHVDDCDKYLLNHFLDKVMKLIFPVLDANQHGSARADVIMPALESNKAYLHCCLSIAATHMKATAGLTDEQIDNDICRHRYAAVSELCQALNRDNDHSGILEATLGMIFFQCAVGRPNDVLPDIAWHQHFEAATSLIHKLELPMTVTNLVESGHSHPPFNMALASWIDILGSSMVNRLPVFADTYRTLNMNNSSAGLAELMGCDDKIMFLISEVVCLDMQRNNGLGENVLCDYITRLGIELTQIHATQEPVQSCFSSTGAIKPKQLSINITSVFLVAARIYLCSLVPAFEPRSESMEFLMAQFADLMNFIPVGPDGFDRSLVWPLLITGSVSMPESPFRTMFEGRCAALGESAHFGSFGRINELLRDVWQKNDPVAAMEEWQGVHWRDVMQQKGWDYLLI